MFNPNELKEKCAGVEKWLQSELSSIRTGRAAPAILDFVQVEAYGQNMSIKELANITMEDAKTIKIEPWDQGVMKAIEKSITTSNLGLSTAPFEKGIRVIFPELTSERREQFIKAAKNKLEEARISLRGLRDKTLKELEEKEKSGSISEDDRFRFKTDVQKVIDDCSSKLSDVAERIEAEIKS